MNVLKKLAIVSLGAMSLSFTNTVLAGEITLYHHQTGNLPEKLYIEEAIKEFNSTNKNNKVLLNYIPEATFTQSIIAAASANQLPCLIRVDQPTVPRFVQAGYLKPLGGFIDDEIINKINPNGKGVYKGKIYSIGQHDVSLTMFTRKSILKKYGIRIPTIESPWTKEELDSALKKLKDSGKYEYPLDLNLIATGEWRAYGYAPFLQSFGGDLINRKNFSEAEGTLNGEAGLKFANWFQELIKKGYINARPTDAQGFINSKIAIHYDGSWDLTRYKKIFGDDLLYLPTPNFGTKPVVGTGSWHYAVSKSCKNPELAKEFLGFVFSDKQMAKLSDMTGMLPTSDRVAEITKNFKTGSEARILYEYSKNFGIRRPETPAYPMLSLTFAQLIGDLIDGKDAQESLDKAVDKIEQDLSEHNNYGFSSKGEN